jgi:hypothetical protein
MFGSQTGVFIPQMAILRRNMMINRSTSGFRGAIFSDKKRMDINRILNWFGLWLIAVSG